MFIKDKFSSESYIHVCNDKTEKQMKKNTIEVRLHDISTFTILNDESGKPKMEHIDFCPYCGCNLQKDAFDNK